MVARHIRSQTDILEHVTQGHKRRIWKTRSGRAGGSRAAPFPKRSAKSSGSLRSDSGQNGERRVNQSSGLINTDTVLQTVDDWLERTAKKNQRDDAGWFHPSSLSNSCDMAVALDFLGYTKSSKWTPARVQRIFSIGNGVDRAWKERLKKSGLSVVGSGQFPTLKIEIPEWRIRGECDDIIRIPNAEMEHGVEPPEIIAIAEVKSINQRGFDGELPLPEHRIQTHCYMKGHGLRDAVVIYENKNDSEVKIVHVPWDEAVWREIANKIVRIIAAIQSEDGYLFRECKYGCDYGDACKKYDRDDGLNRLELLGVI